MQSRCQLHRVDMNICQRQKKAAQAVEEMLEEYHGRIPHIASELRMSGDSKMMPWVGQETYLPGTSTTDQVSLRWDLKVTFHIAILNVAALWRVGNG